jgi:hypothetical protein
MNLATGGSAGPTQSDNACMDACMCFHAWPQVNSTSVRSSAVTGCLVCVGTGGSKRGASEREGTSRRENTQLRTMQCALVKGAWWEGWRG